MRTRATLGALMRTAAENRDMLLLGDGEGNYIFPNFYPVADGLFERSLLLAIPSCLTAADENDIVTAFEKVLGALEAGAL